MLTKRVRKHKRTSLIIMLNISFRRAKRQTNGGCSLYLLCLVACRQQGQCFIMFSCLNSVKRRRKFVRDIEKQNLRSGHSHTILTWKIPYCELQDCTVLSETVTEVYKGLTEKCDDSVPSMLIPLFDFYWQRKSASCSENNIT